MPAGDLSLATELSSLRFIGPERAAQLHRLGLRTVLDLLMHQPRRYEDRRNVAKIAQLEVGNAAVVSGRITVMGVKRFRGGSRSVFELVLEDETGRLHCRWWNQPFRERYYKVGEHLLVFGKLKELKPRVMDQPETESAEDQGEAAIHLHRVAPIYPLTEGLSQRWLRGLIARLCPHTASLLTPTALPISKVAPEFSEAVIMMHNPQEVSDGERARRRLALEELIHFQLSIQRRRRNLQAKARSPRCGGNNERIRPFLAALPFKLTASQTSVLREIRDDLDRTIPMRRLLQGDVGSGKTVVAACAALMAIESGFSVAVMAPTEILAQQHFKRFQEWLTPLGIGVGLRTGSVKTDIDAGSLLGWQNRAEPTTKCGVVVGTHALITGSFEIERLGLVIIDEQHKFGVTQRDKLVRKGVYPHVLAMTATPIPRTLGLTLYGDLDISVLNELPSGRGSVRTYVRAPDRLPQVWDFVKTKLAAGQQAYVIYPRVDEADAAGVKALLIEHKALVSALAPHSVAILHGRMPAEEKERVMERFHKGTIHALLATSLVEVGVDVPNATVMVVESASQFGLAQLHQLRGRIGRGKAESFCILVAEGRSAEAKERLAILEKTRDGFEIAEADLKLRGPGELLGQGQAGAPDFKFADLATDRPIIEHARALARELLDNEPVSKTGSCSNGDQT